MCDASVGSRQVGSQQGGDALRFGVLGPLQVVTEDVGTARAVSTPRLRAVLAVLLWRPNQPFSFDELADLVWDGRPPGGAREAVRALVMRLRRQLDPLAAARIVTRAPGYAVEVSGDELDTSQAAMLTREADAAVRGARWPDASRAATGALSLWRGTPLIDVPSELLRDQWIPVLDQLHLRAMTSRIEADLHQGRHEQLVPELRDLTARHPLRESLHKQLMLALARSGRRAEALDAYQVARRALAAELGVDPSPELRRLEERIREDHADLYAPPPDVEDQAEALRTPAPVVLQLPPSARSFVGRHAELARIESLVTQALDPAAVAGTVVIPAIDGMAGVGKTALAVHAAHRLADRFPDGQLFIDMYGYTQGHAPRPASEALDVFLRALGVPPQQIPPGTDERTAMFRDRLSGTRTLVVLDNVADEAQVRPLLPGSAGCVVLVTSRRRLRSLDDTYPFSLDVLSTAEALELFRAVAGAGRVPPDDPALTEIVGLCGRLPLAVRIAAALLRHRPVWTPRHLTEQLRARSTRISALSDGDRNLSAIFDLSYRGLTVAEQRAFRYLGLVAGPDVDLYATVALTRSDPSTAGRLLNNLVDHNLVIEYAPGRYHLHDLIRLHARALAEHDPVASRDAALMRLANYYEHTAQRADALISRLPTRAPTDEPPGDGPALADADQARAWLRTERPNLLAVLRDAGTPPAHIVGLTAGLATLLRYDGPWPDALALHARAVAAARSMDDQAGRAAALVELGIVRNLTGDAQGGLDALDEARGLYQQLGDRLGQANTLTELANIRAFIDEHQTAERDLEQALQLYRELDSPRGQATALTQLANIRRYIGDYPGAIPALEQALRLVENLDDLDGRAKVLNALGNARRYIGDLTEAARDLEDALHLHEHLRHQLGRANTLSELGELRRLTGDYPAATRCLEQGLRIYQDLGNQMGQANAQVWLGSVRHATGDLDGATGLLHTAVDTFRRIGSRGSEAWALNRLAAVIATTGDLTRAEAMYRQALGLARETRQLDDEAHALEGSGECAVRSGDTAAGLDDLNRALEIFQQLTMRRDADRVCARLASLIEAEEKRMSNGRADTRQ